MAHIDLSVLVDQEHDNLWQRRAEHFADSNQLPLLTDLRQVSTTYYLHYQTAGLFLCQSGKKAAGPISASFIAGKNLHRLRHGGGKGQLIAKAVGLHKGVRPHVLDVTAGLGRDAFVLASLGCKVDMFERVAVVEELLSFALSEAQASEDRAVLDAVEGMTLNYGDAISYLSDADGCVADVIYLDPMYPVKTKSAAVKKEMRAFHDLVGGNPDDAALLALALSKARCRVVVKRPRLGVEIDGVKPTLKLEGKSARYDIYTLRKLEEFVKSS